MNKHGHSRAFSQSRKLTLNFYRSLDYACGSESIIFSSNLCKPIEIYTYVKQMRPFTRYLAAKHPKHCKFDITDMRQKPVDFFYCTARASTLSSRNNFANLGFFAKVSVPVKIYNFLVEVDISLELSSFVILVYIQNTVLQF